MCLLGIFVYVEDIDMFMFDSFKEKIKGIFEEKLEILDLFFFIMLLGIMECFYKLMEGKLVEEIEVYFDGMIEVVEVGKFNLEIDMVFILFNIEVKGFNGWKVKCFKSFNLERELGFIYLSCYMSSCFGGVKIFVNVFFVIYFEDLIVGNVDIVIVGVLLDMGFYYCG